MKNIWYGIQTGIAACGGVIGWLFGGLDGFFYALIAFVVIDYITGVLVAITKKELSSSVGFKGIAGKVAIFCLVGVANILDVNILGGAAVLRTAVICFYLSNEGISILENSAALGIKYPQKLMDVLKQIHPKDDNGKDDET